MLPESKHRTVVLREASATLHVKSITALVIRFWEEALSSPLIALSSSLSLFAGSSSSRSAWPEILKSLQQSSLLGEQTFFPRRMKIPEEGEKPNEMSNTGLLNWINSLPTRALQRITSKALSLANFRAIRCCGSKLAVHGTWSLCEKEDVVAPITTEQMFAVKKSAERRRKRWNFGTKCMMKVGRAMR